MPGHIGCGIADMFLPRHSGTDRRAYWQGENEGCAQDLPAPPIPGWSAGCLDFATGALWCMASLPCIPLASVGVTRSIPNVRSGAECTVGKALLVPDECVKLLLKFEDHSGLYLYHCQNLERENLGLMRDDRVEAWPKANRRLAGSASQVAPDHASVFLLTPPNGGGANVSSCATHRAVKVVQ